MSNDNRNQEKPGQPNQQNQHQKDRSNQRPNDRDQQGGKTDKSDSKKSW